MIFWKLTAYNVMHKFDVICISESYLNSDTSSNVNNLNMPGYNMSRADHPSGNRRGGVCIYYKESLPIKMLNISYLQECICFDLKIRSKLCTIVSLYRSPSQSADEFNNFLNKLNLTVNRLLKTIRLLPITTVINVRVSLETSYQRSSCTEVYL